MQTRHRSWLPIPVVAAVLMTVVLPTGSQAAPVSVAVESVGIARSTGCAVVHIATSQPTPVEIDRGAADQVVERFMDAILAPDAESVIARTPSLSALLSVTQDATAPPVVMLKATSGRGQSPVVERFADGRGLVVRLFVDIDGPRTAPKTGRLPVPGPLTQPAGANVASSAGVVPASLPASAALAPLTSPIDKRGLGGGSSPVDAVTDVPTDAAPRATLARLLTPGNDGDNARGGLPSRSLAPGGLAAIAGLAALDPLSSAQVRPAVQLATLVSALTGRPAPMPSVGRVTAIRKAATLEQVRVVGIDPLQVAIDCSAPTAYRVGQLASPRGFGVTFPDATVGATCQRLVALYPASGSEVEALDTRDGAMVIIPAPAGSRCETREGSAAGTIVCEVVADPTMVAQRPAPDGAAPQAGTILAEPRINLDFQDAPIVEILTALAQYAHKNIITTSAVVGTMTVHYDDVTLSEALTMIARLNGLDYTLVGERNFVVGTPEEIDLVANVGSDGMPLEFIYKPENTTPQKVASELQDIAASLNIQLRVIEDAGSVVFTGLPDRATATRLQGYATQVDVAPIEVTRWLTLDYIRPSDVKNALGELLPEVEIMLPGDGQQISLVGLSGLSVDVDEAETLVQSIDVDTSGQTPMGAGPMVARTIRVSYLDPEKAVEVLTAMYTDQVEVQLLSGSMDLGEVTGTQDAGGLRPAATILIRGPEETVDDVERLIVQLDVAPPQIEITTTITDVRVDRDKDLGLNWSLPGLVISEQSTAGDGFKVGKVIRAPFNDGGSGAFSAGFDAKVIESNSTVLSKTTLVAVNGKSARFLVGDIVPYEVSVAGDGTVSRSVEFEEIGLGLDFSPSVDRDGLITLYLSPTVRSFTGYSPNGYPIIATREADTIVRVRDGDTIVIGGLLRDEELKTLTGIPLLKDIPFFGDLFKHRQTQKRKSEVVVFAEVKLLPSDGFQPAEPVIAAVGQ